MTDSNELKLQHYRQRVAELSVEYEERIANLRVEYTNLGESHQVLEERVKELESRVQNFELASKASKSEVVKGEVLDDERYDGLS